MKTSSLFRHIVLASLLTLISIFASSAQQVRFGNEAADTLRINSMLVQAAAIERPNDRVAAMARQFIDTPYVAGTLESPGEEILTANIDSVDCTTLIDYVMALAITGGEHRTSWRDFIYNLEKIRYRSGRIDGYGSRLHYISEWAVDNIHRGNFIEVTDMSPDVSYETKTLDFMSTHRNLYPALASDETFGKIKNAEIGYRSHRFPFIKTKNVAKAAKSFLREGDIVALTTSTPGLDVQHMAIIVFDGSTPRLLHASSKEGRVVIDRTSLGDYLARNRSITGIRVFRLKE